MHENDFEHRSSLDRLLSANQDTEMQDMTSKAPDVHESSTAAEGQPSQPEIPTFEQDAAPEYRVYKRRWFGLLQLVLLNIMISWDVS